MDNNFFYFPEFALTIGTLIILTIALFLKKNVFEKTVLFSVLLLLLVSFMVFKDTKIFFASYDVFFKNSKFIIFFKLLVIYGSIASMIISINFFNEIKLSRFEIPILMLFATLGMLVLISSNNLMTMYLGIELQSLALYVLAAIQRNSIKSAESGIKYFVLGALSSGILLYGCSLIYGFTGNTNFEEIKIALNSLDELSIGILFGLVFVLVGLAFKISAAPFHMWTPDVYEGAPTSVTAFFAIVPKVSAIALLYRFCIEPFGDFYGDWRQIIIFLSLTSMFVGAFAAIVQKNIKRLLAYSSIGHIGYALIGLASANSEGVKGLIIYMFVYVLMNIGIFSIILSLKYKDKYIENIRDLSGLSKKKPMYSLCIAILMFSMAGIPPFAGFFGKFYIFVSALEAELIYLAILGVIASVIAAFYYLKIIKVMYFDEVVSDKFYSNITSKSLVILLISILAISLFVLFPSFFIKIASNASSLFYY